MADLPVACTLSPAALKARKENLLNALHHRADERRELPDGYRLRFVAEGDTLAAIARTVDAERQCCRFLHFTVTVEPDDGPLRSISPARQGRGSFLPRCSTCERVPSQFAPVQNFRR